ncbi:hypothetical protein [Amycolatopsis sp. NBC_01480]|uniref:hypothetical protein n=1 Tax=Amycolatopsis sp. NBC_01480 TaxID=2903562 RepID=UPI002E28E4DF|nr:hypothetical protein [Amycolatopsis sp. NBC_01480]
MVMLDVEDRWGSIYHYCVGPARRTSSRSFRGALGTPGGTAASAASPGTTALPDPSAAWRAPRAGPATPPTAWRLR